MKIKLTLFFLCLFQVSLVSAAQYSFGVVPQFEVRKLYKIWRPILTVLEQKTGHRFKIVVTKSIKQFEIEFGEGNFDFA